MIPGSPRILYLLICGAWLNVVPPKAALAAAAPKNTDVRILERRTGGGGSSSIEDDNEDARVFLSFLSRVRKAATPLKKPDGKRGRGNHAKSHPVPPQTPRGAPPAKDLGKEHTKDEIPTWPFYSDGPADGFYNDIPSWNQVAGADESLRAGPVGKLAYAPIGTLTQALSSMLPLGHVPMKMLWAENFLVLSSSPTSGTGGAMYGPEMPFDSTIMGFKRFVCIPNQNIKAVAWGVFLDQARHLLRIYTVGPASLGFVLYEQLPGQEQPSVIKESAATRSTYSNSKFFDVKGLVTGGSPSSPGNRYLLIAAADSIPSIKASKSFPIPLSSKDDGQRISVYSLFSGAEPYDAPHRMVVIRIGETLLPKEPFGCSGWLPGAFGGSGGTKGKEGNGEKVIVLRKYQHRGISSVSRGGWRPTRPQVPKADLRFNIHDSLCYFSHYAAFGAKLCKNSIQYHRAQHAVLATAHVLLFVAASTDDPLTEDQLQHLMKHEIFDSDQAFSEAVDNRPALGIFCDPNSPRLIIRTVGRPPVDMIIYSGPSLAASSQNGTVQAFLSSTVSCSTPDRAMAVPLPIGVLERPQRCVIVILSKTSPKAWKFDFKMPARGKLLRQEMERLLKALGPQEYLYATLTTQGTGRQTATDSPTSPSMVRGEEGEPIE